MNTPSSSFVPLAGPSAAALATSFTPLFAKIAKPAEAAPQQPVSPPAGDAAVHVVKSTCEPSVKLHRDAQDRVMGIHIECGCGKVIDLACVYDQK